jgi:hypothetical protein
MPYPFAPCGRATPETAYTYTPRRTPMVVAITQNSAQIQILEAPPFDGAIWLTSR